MTKDIVGLYSFVKNVFFERMDKPTLIHRVNRVESIFLERQGLHIDMLNNYVSKTIAGYVGEYFEDYKINTKIFDEYDSRQKQQLLNINNEIAIIQEKTAKRIYDSFFRLSLQGKSYMETVVILEKDVNEAIRDAYKSIKNIIRQIGYFMLLYDYQNKGFNKYRLISSNDACDECKSGGSHTYQIDNLSEMEFAPLVHPNCRCTIEIIDDKNRGIAVIDDKSAQEHLQILGISNGTAFWYYLCTLFSPLNVISDVDSFGDIMSIVFKLSGKEIQSLVLNKWFHRLVWLIGAKTYLKSKEYYTSAQLLKHSLLQSPSDQYMGNSSRLAGLIKTDKEFLEELDKKISITNGKEIDDTIPVEFTDGDLYYSIHKSDIKVTGYKMDNGKWKIYGTLDDEYDYTEIMTFMEGRYATLGTVANDAAVISQLIDAINPYHIHVEFELER